MFLNLFFALSPFLLWKQSDLQFSVYDSCYLSEYVADIIMLKILPVGAVRWATRHGVRGG